MPLQRPFLHAVLHLFQFMVTVTGESLCPSQVAQAPICWHQSVTRERFGIFLAELGQRPRVLGGSAADAADQQFLANLTPGCHVHAGAAESAGILAGAVHRQLHAHTGMPQRCGT